jgi:SpoVK/Ycf46/Vps4 family AAA+-type ATPase
MTDMADDALVQSLSAAVERSPDSIELRLHLAELLFERGRYPEALTHCSAALNQDPANKAAVELLQRCTVALGSRTDSPKETKPASAPSAGFDWRAAEKQVGDIIQPAFVEEPPEPVGDADHDAVQRSMTRLSDVAGMSDVKRQLELSLLGPLRNPELMKAYKISARGGLLLYGPPGCGKTYIARAVSGELGASFYPIGIADVMQQWFGESEQRIRSIFATARRNAPCVLFFDELDALGHKRSALSGSSGLRPLVNALLEEFDPATAANDGVYVLGASNHPWDVDSALRRPGRFDRMIFVGLPDAEARAAIARLHLKDRPLSGIDVRSIAARTVGFSGADLAHVCDSATQLAMADSLRSGQVRPVTMADIDGALGQVKPSTGPWFDIARNVVEFGNRDGAYDDLANYLRRGGIR